MICRQTSQGWEIIYQRNHALLAAEMLADWRHEARPQPWWQLLNACSQHDHGWKENEADPLIDADGHPVDFLHMPIEISIGMSRRNLSNAEAQSRWCGILVARHAQYLYSAKDDEIHQGYVAEATALREAWMAEIGVSEDQVEAMYELLCWADTLSLLVCCQPSEFTRSLELQARGEKYQAVQLSETQWSLHPWPYQRSTQTFEYEVRHLCQPDFATIEELREALKQTPVTVHQVHLRQEPA